MYKEFFSNDWENWLKYHKVFIILLIESLTWRQKPEFNLYFELSLNFLIWYFAYKHFFRIKSALYQRKTESFNTYLVFCPQPNYINQFFFRSQLWHSLWRMLSNKGTLSFPYQSCIKTLWLLSLTHKFPVFSKLS